MTGGWDDERARGARGERERERRGLIDRGASPEKGEREKRERGERERAREENGKMRKKRGES